MISRAELQAALETQMRSPSTRSAAEIATMATANPVKRTAIFAVHGISPIQRYAFQDQVAAAMQSYLNAREAAANSNATWSSIVHWPAASGSDAATQSVKPSALRIYRSDDSPTQPTNAVYDVYEGYWSPLSKGKTTVTSALRWLLNATFLGANSTAAIPATAEKIWSDVGYLLAMLGLGMALCVASLCVGLAGWQWLSDVVPAISGASFWGIALDPLKLQINLPLPLWVEIALGLVLGYVAAQLVNVIKASRDRDARSAALAQDATGKSFASNVVSAQSFHRFMQWVLAVAFIALLIAMLAVAWCSFGTLDVSWQVVGAVLTVSVAVALLQGARAVGDFAVESVLGDVQIYTTHDNNSTFYAIRQQIIDAVAGALRGVLTATDAGRADASANAVAPYYQTVHVLGHSLGSTIAMDAMIMLREMVEQGSIEEAGWSRIRSFTTFGTALEKTRFFFDVRQPTIDAAQDQWDNDVYGSFFSDDRSVLANADNTQGIYWSNYWYFRDVVANAIVSYASDVQPNNGFAWGAVARTICTNVEIPHARPRFAWVHSDYLADPHFWGNVGPVLTA